ncbi:MULTISPECIES: CDGSH iron-sulfur domain-containing protein [unclassified Streptomyces]|uniref:CDGSH iron-sulfur domain-containing protein n=1 Tax=unclassified Streptomyces TaxID=2593676 RepID=UPI00364EF1F2
MPNARPDKGDNPNTSADGPRPGPPRRVTMRRRGPILVDGPVEVELEDGSIVFSDRFRVALCTCRRSRRYPWCDTSHRDRS